MSINKKCQPGVICVENVTLFFIMILLFIAIYFIYVFFVKNNNYYNDNDTHNHNQNVYIQEKESSFASGFGFPGFGLMPRPGLSVSNMPGDVLLNPYVPPLRDERYLVPPGRVPINISTNVGAVDTSYRQVGLLTPLNHGSNNKNEQGKIIPLMGRPLFTNRDKWQYYSMSDQNNSVKLPIIFKNRNATNEYGVDKIYNNDIVYVEGYKQAFRVTEYENDTIKYLPFI